MNLRCHCDEKMTLQGRGIIQNDRPALLQLYGRTMRIIRTCYWLSPVVRQMTRRSVAETKETLKNARSGANDKRERGLSLIDEHSAFPVWGSVKQ